MEGDIKEIYDQAEEAMDKTIEHFKNELTKIRAGKASPDMLDGLRVDYYGVLTPLNQASTVTSQDARTLVVQPFEPSMITPIEKVIVESNLGITPQNDGKIIRLVLPQLTEERRKQLVKQAKEETENTRVAIRTHRRDANEALKKAQKDGVSEDEVKAGETEIQKLTDQYNQKVEDIFQAKEKDIMTV